MSIDTYAICPCGSGKKIKFCTKCKSSVHELDRVLKMVEGGQVVPALDRLATILEEHPDAAWALAVRGRLLMDLREYDSFRENAERFTRLQPSNPLALTQSAASALFGKDPGKATELLLQALTESGQNVDSFVLDVASLLAYGLAGNGVLLTARVYAMLALVSEGYEGRDMAAGVLQQINQDPAINLLSKSVPDLIERPRDADWGERYDEAALLLSSNKVVLAENKFESLQRTAPFQPAILAGLLNCAIWRGDYARQTELLEKLSQCEDLPIEERARYLATSFVAGPESKAIDVTKIKLIAEVDSIDEIQMALTSAARFNDLPSEILAQLKGDQEVAPRTAFQMLDRDPPGGEGMPSADQIPESLGLVTLYGRQTDRAARIEVIGLNQSDEALAKEALNQADASLQWTTEEMGQAPITVVALPQPGGVKPTSQQQADQLQEMLFADRVLDKLSQTKLTLFDGESLASVGEDSAKELHRRAFLRFLEGEDTLSARDENLITRLAEIAKLDPPPAISVDSQAVETVPSYDLNRIDPSGLELDDLAYLLQRARQVSATTIGRKVSRQMIEMDLPAGSEEAQMKMMAYGFIMQHASSSQEAIETVEKAKAFATANSIPLGQLLLAEIPLRLRMGDAEKFQECVNTIVANHSNDQQIMGQLQQLLMQLGFLRPDGSPRQAPPASATAPGAASPGGGSGLWTPDGGGSGASTPQPSASDSGSSSSKLWVPGMD